MGSLLMQAQANLLQARANEATSRGLHLLTFDWIGMQCITNIEPDTLEAWYAFKDDATHGSTISGHGEQQAKAVWVRGEASSEESNVDKHGMFARAGEVIAHMSDTVVKTEPSPERPFSAQGFGVAQAVGASDESLVVAQADAEVASPVQPAT